MWRVLVWSICSAPGRRVEFVARVVLLACLVGWRYSRVCVPLICSFSSSYLRLPAHYCVFASTNTGRCPGASTLCALVGVSALSM